MPLDFLKSPRQRARELPELPELPKEPPPSVPRKRHRPPSQHFRALSNRLSKVFDRGRDDPGPDTEFQQLRSELDKLRQNEKGVKERVGEFEAEIANLEKRIEERGNRRNELERVTKELAVAQRFLSTADSLSQAEVVRAMEALNEEIFQLTSVVADKVQVSEKHVQEPKQMEGFRDKIHSCTPLTAYLEVVEAKHLDDSLAIQIGWQAMLAEWSSVIIQAWVITDLGTGELSRDFSDIYASITSQCDQAVAGKWRAIYFGASDDASPETRRRLPEDLIRALSALPVLCGYIRSQKIYTELGNAFEQRIGPLLDKCLKFRKMIGEGITSTNIRPYFLNSGEEYDPSSAELEYEDDESASKEKRGVVACSLGLGLYLTRTSRGDDGRFTESREQILKPKVILQETLKEIIA